MPAIFERDVRKLLRQLGKQELKPVKSLNNADKFCQFNILRKSKKRSCFSWFGEQPDVPTDFSLLDILEPSSSTPETAVTGPFIYSDNMVQKVKGDVAVNVGIGLQLGASGEVAQSHAASLNFHIINIPMQTWTELRCRKPLKPEPWFLEQCRKRREQLYVVTEAVQITNSPELSSKRSVKGSGTCSTILNLPAEVQGQVEGLQEAEKTLALPKGMVMAYKKKKLIVKEDGWDICLFTDDEDKEDTFQDDNFFSCKSAEVEVMVGTTGPILPIGRIEEPWMQNFKYLQEDISRKMEVVAEMSKNIKDTIFQNILVMLGDREALQDLMDKLEERPVGHLDGPGGNILNAIPEKSRYTWSSPLSYIVCILEVIMVLNDIQHDLLAWSMKNRILFHQSQLVRSILEPNFKYPWNIPFTLKPELLAPLQGEALVITYELLGECGLNMELNNPRSTWDLEAKQPLSALFGCLSMLQRLIET